MSNRVAEKDKPVRAELRPWELQEDLATVACYAAGEIDDAILGRSEDFEAVNHLVEIISNSIVRARQSRSREFVVDPRTAVAVGQALEHSRLSASINTIDELKNKSREIITLLKQLIAEPQKVSKNKKTDLKNLRQLCLSLSDSALAYEEPIDSRWTNGA